jgi:cytochrome oxidase Cu insertion factor (SCO1/SenC/PrrC family)
MKSRRAGLYGLVLSVLAVGLSLVPAAGDDALDDLLTAFQMTPLGDQKPPPFTLDSIDGKSISLANVRGRAVLLYFWESG